MLFQANMKNKNKVKITILLSPESEGRRGKKKERDKAIMCCEVHVQTLKYSCN